MYKKYLCIVAGFMLSLFGFLPGLWDSFIIHFAPKAVLTTALQETITQLQERFENDPVLLVLNTLDPEGKQTVDVKLETEQPYLGKIQYDMVLRTEPHRLSGNGVIRGDQRELNLAVYADVDFTAVSSDELVSGQYYGITYDTFLQDVQKIPLLTWLTGDVVLQKWNSNVLRIQKSMEEGYPVVQLPVLASDDLLKLLLYVIAAPSDTQEVRITINEEVVDGYKISYSLNDPEILNQLQQIMDLENANSVDTAVDFYLYEKRLVALDLTVETETAKKQICLDLGTDILVEPITATIISEEGSAISRKDIRVETDPEASVFSERWEFCSTGREDVSIYYEWEPDSGDMLLSINDSEMIPLKFSGTEDEIRIEADDLTDIFHHIKKYNFENNKQTVSGSVIVRKGSEITTPVFRNLDQWSMDDFWILMEGLGSLIGFTF